MAIEKLQYTKDWNNPADFPTIETDETKVRADKQVLHDEARDFINDKLIPAIDENTGKSHEHENKELLDTYTQTEENLADAVSKKHEHTKSDEELAAAVDKAHEHTKSDEELAAAVNKAHEHSKTDEEIAATVDAKHEHANKDALDAFEGVSQEVGSSTTKVPSEAAVNKALAQSGNMPAGGLAGQILRKWSNTPYDYGWAPLTPEASGAAPAQHTHTPEEAGAAPAQHTHTPEQAGAAPAQHTRTPEEVGAAPAAHGHAYTEVGAAPAGFGLGEAAKDISNTDLIATLQKAQSGFYKGHDVANAPDANWWFFVVTAHDASWSTVFALSFTGATHRSAIGQWVDDGTGTGTSVWKGWAEHINTANIGSQGVNYANGANYANSAGNADTVDSKHVVYDAGTYGLRVIAAGTTDIGAGASCTSGYIYLVYE